MLRTLWERVRRVALGVQGNPAVFLKGQSKGHFPYERSARGRVFIHEQYDADGAGPEAGHFGVPAHGMGRQPEGLHIEKVFSWEMVAPAV